MLRVHVCEGCNSNAAQALWRKKGRSVSNNKRLKSYFCVSSVSKYPILMMEWLLPFHDP